MRFPARRRAALLGSATAGIMAVTVLTGAASASAATATTAATAAKAPTTATAPQKASNPAPQTTKVTADKATKVAADKAKANQAKAATKNLPSWAHGDLAKYKAGLAVKKAYTDVTVTDVTATAKGYVVTVSVDGRTGTVTVSSDYSVGKLALQRTGDRH